MNTTQNQCEIQTDKNTIINQTTPKNKLNCDDNNISDQSNEELTQYKRGGYHPVKLGDVFNNRYCVLKKLGYGQFSTVWLAVDNKLPNNHKNKCVALKIQKSALRYTEAAEEEIISHAIVREKDVNNNKNVVLMLDHFFHFGPHGKHKCMIFEIMDKNLLDVIKEYNFKGMPLDLVKKYTRDLLIALDFLHSRCSIIHTDLKPENILISLSKRINVRELIEKAKNNKNEAAFIDYLNTKNLNKNQKRRLRNKNKKLQMKSDSFDTNQSSQSDEENLDYLDIEEEIHAKIADLGNSCFIDHHNNNEITTRQYRCIENILGLEYSTSADIWSLACVVFEMLTGDFLFEPKRDLESGLFSKNEDHIALIIELLGPFPQKIFKYGKDYYRYFDRKGEMKNIKNIPHWPLYDLLIEKYNFSIQKAKEIALFLSPMLNYNPLKRVTAKEALKHDWLNIKESDKDYRPEQDFGESRSSSEMTGNSITYHNSSQYSSESDSLKKGRPFAASV